MNAQSAASRYLFDLDFDAQERAKDEEEAVPTITVFEHEAQMAALERRVRAEAHEAGKREAVDEGSHALAEQTKQLSSVASQLLAKLDQEIGMREERAVRIAIAAAKKLARRLMDAEPLGEVEMLFRACLAPMFDASHLVVRMHEGHVDAVRERLEAIAVSQGYEGRLVFLGEADLAPGDARIEWADGGVARDQGSLEQTIDNLISSYLAARGKPYAAAQSPDDPNGPAALAASMEGASHE